MGLPYRDDEKLMIFIDGSNLFKQCKNYSEETGTELEIDMIKIRKELKQKYNLIRTYYYGSIPPIDKEDEESGDEEAQNRVKEIKQQIDAQIKFYHFLMYNGFDVTFFPLRIREKSVHCPKCEVDTKIKVWVEKGVDVALVTEMMSQAANKNCDVVILVAGDLDYREALKRVKQKGIKVKIAFFGSYTSSEFKRCADDFVDLEKFLHKIKKD